MALTNYDKIATVYKASDEKPDKLFSILPTVLSMVGDLNGKSVLDLGCGSGFFGRAFADAGAAHVIGIDSSWQQIELARQLSSSPAISYLVSDVTQCDFPMVDVVCTPFLLNYIRDVAVRYTFLKNIRCALKPNGMAIFVIDRPSDRDLSKFGARKIVHGAKIDGAPMTIQLYQHGGEHICDLQNYYVDLAILERMFLDSGFEEVSKTAPLIARHGIEKYGEHYWEGYLDDTQLEYYACF